MERRTLFVDVILPLALEGNYTYRVPLNLNEYVAVGKRVVVQFGKKKVYTALIYKVHEKAPTAYAVKYIYDVLDMAPIVNEKQLQLWEWMAHYYCATLGEIMNTAMPAAFKLASETKIVINPDFDNDTSALNDKEYLIYEALISNSVLSLTEVSKILDQIKIIPYVKNLIEKGVVLLEEEVKETYKPKIEVFLTLSEKYKDEAAMRALYDSLDKKAPKQLAVLMAHQMLAHKEGDLFKPLARKKISQKTGNSSAVINAMVKKGIFVQEEKEVSRLESYDKPLAGSLLLNEPQEEAFKQIKNKFETTDVVLLHGVTSSGKTEIYVKLIEEVIAKGQQVLFLMPEIALTTQMINRLRRYFGNEVGVYHSKFNDSERVEIWYAVMNSASQKPHRTYKIVLGARSSLFLPFDNLGLIIIDEEQEQSYKQYNAPRYHARDAALYLRLLHKSRVLLGTATPSLETYHNCETGKFQKVELSQRYGNFSLPEVVIADLKDLHKKRMMKSFFSPVLLDTIEACLAAQQQVILFQNRRGFALWLECRKCTHIPMCKCCDVTLTYHKKFNRLRCHYCGYNTKVPEVCPACRSEEIKMKSYGTERVEDELKIFFPKAHIARMDYDTTRKKNAFQNLIDDFQNKKIDILVGTQMVSKGMDFDNVGLVGILNADNILHYPDFRSFERAFQMLTQVCGRTGRKSQRGKVLLQTYNPHHFVIESVINNNTHDFYKSQLRERHRFIYPPFCRLILFTLKHRNSTVLNNGAAFFASDLKRHFPKMVLGPEYPHVAKIKNEFVKTVLLKVDKKLSVQKVRQTVNRAIANLKNNDKFKALKAFVDVDPV